MSRLSASGIDRARRCGWSFRPDVKDIGNDLEETEDTDETGDTDTDDTADTEDEVEDEVEDDASKGTIEHAHIEKTMTTGDETPMSPTHQQWLDRWYAKRPAGVAWTPERAVAIHPKTGRAMWAPLGLDARDYSWCPRGWIPGTVDLFGLVELSSDETTAQYRLQISDWKTGRGDHIGEPSDSGQLFMNATALWLLLRDTYDITEVVVEYVLVNDERCWTQRAELKRSDMLAFLIEMAELVETIESGPMPKPGPWCSVLFCKYNGVCPATKDALPIAAGAIEPHPAGVVIDPSEFVDIAHAAWQALLLSSAEKQIKLAKDALKAYADTTPIPLGDGRTYRKVEGVKDTIDADSPKTVSILHRHFGSSVEQCFKRTKKFVKKQAEDLIRAGAEERGVTQAEWKRELYDDLAAGGVVTQRPTVQFRVAKDKVVKARKVEPAGEQSAAGEGGPNVE